MAPAGGTQLAEEQSIPTAHSLTVKLDYVPPLPKTQECCNTVLVVITRYKHKKH